MARYIAVFLLFLSSALFAVSPGETLAVSVRDGQLRSTPGFLSPIEAAVVYGDEVRVLEVRGDWARVRAGATGDEGWIHTSSILAPRDMHLAGAETRDSGTTSREIALAGRGFSEQVEREYEEQQSLDFGPVDEMERLLLQPAELGEFLGEIGAGIDQEAE